ncbi:MAG: SDR family NAD(P)-dependent oxidoreductase [Rhodospirillaceae bacterium]|nr:SDR family NAD(P)-dependent oxidoreductase [Rhodospirillaceae bacterium]
MEAKPPSILITGASSGIGAALALHYAGPGVVLALSGRDGRRLDEVSAACRSRGAIVRPRLVDVTDRKATAVWVGESDEADPLDLVIANAGVSAGTARESESEEQVRWIFAVNVDGVLNTVLPVIPRMQARRRGQLALMSSLASFRGFPGAPAYSASKAAVRVWGEGLRGDLAGHGIRVSVICPGFVVSRMTAANDFHMPMLMAAERAAAIIARGLAADRARISFPWPMAAGAWLLGALPPGWTDGLLARLPRKA